MRLSKTSAIVLALIVLPVAGMAIELALGGDGTVTSSLVTLSLTIGAIAFAVMVFRVVAAKAGELDKKDD